MSLQQEPRSVALVTIEILQIIPKTEENLIQALIHFRNGLWNIAPEVMGNPIYWMRLQGVLKSNIPTFDTEWKVAVLRIFNNDPTIPTP